MYTTFRISCPNATKALFLPLRAASLLYLDAKKVPLVQLAAQAHSVITAFVVLLPWLVRELFFTCTLIVAGADSCP